MVLQGTLLLVIFNCFIKAVYLSRHCTLCKYVFEVRLKFPSICILDFQWLFKTLYVLAFYNSSSDKIIPYCLKWWPLSYLSTGLAAI